MSYQPPASARAPWYACVISTLSTLRDIVQVEQKESCRAIAGSQRAFRFGSVVVAALNGNIQEA
jgi:cell division inhibitor SulA